MRSLNLLVTLLVFITGIKAQISVIPNVVHLTSTATPSAGSISLNVSGGTSPYTYSWTPGSLTTKDITNTTFQPYTIKVTDNSMNTVTYQYNVGYKVQWGQFYGTAMKHDTLQNTGVYGWAQAISKNTLFKSTDGWFEYILKDLNQYKVIGFLDSASTFMGSLSDIDYGFYYETSGNTLYKIVNGVTTLVSHPIEGTVLRVERVGNIINLKINGTSTYSVTSATDVAKSWKIKGLVHSANNATLINVGCSFSNQSNIIFPGYGGLNPLVQHVSSPFLNDGSIKVTPVLNSTYTYTWLPGSIVSTSVTSIPFGSYSVTAEDSVHRKDTQVYSVGYKVQWDQFYGTVQKHDTLQNNGVYGWGQAISKNTLSGSTDGWFEYVLKDLNQTKGIGVLNTVSATKGNWSDVDYGFYYVASESALYKVIGGIMSLVSSPLEGTVLRIERIGSTISLKINGVQTYSVINASAASKPWKIKGLVSIISNNTTLINVGCSFSTLSLTSTITNYTDDNNKGQISLTITGGSPPYQVAWNSVKLPSNHNYYVNLITNFPSLTVDTLTLFPKLDSIRQSTVLKNLMPSIFNNKIYDANNDSISFTSIVGTEFSWVSSGVTTNTCSIASASNSLFTVYYGKGQQVTQNVPGSTTNYAVSDIAFKAGDTESYTEFAMVNNTDVIDVGLKTLSSVNNNLVEDMASNTYVHFTGSETSSPLMNIYFNNTLINSSAYLSGDAIGILLDPITQTVSYYKNSVKFLTQGVGSSTIFSRNLQLKIKIKTDRAAIKNIAINWGSLFRIKDITASASDVSCSGPYSGILAFTAYSLWEDICDYTVTGPNGYSSSGTLSPTTYIYGLQAGIYTVSVPCYLAGSGCNGRPSIMSKSFEVAYMPEWTNQAPIGSTNVNPTDHSFNITTNQSNPYTWLGGASSLNLLNSTDAGWTEFNPVLNIGTPAYLFLNTAMAFGLNNKDLATHPSDNDHYFYVTRYIGLSQSGIGGGGSSTSSTGPYLASMSSNGTIVGIPFYTSPTDVLRVNKLSLSGGANMKIEFYKNNLVTPLATSATYASTDLIADLSVNQSNLFISHPRVSFGCPYLQQYAIVKKKLDGGYYNASNKKIYFKYDEEYNDTNGKLTFNIYNASNTVVYSSSSMSTSAPSVVYGDNRFTIDLANTAYYVAGQSIPVNNFYILEVINEKNEKWYLRFKL